MAGYTRRQTAHRSWPP